jgi:thymidylate synthase (FAD)
MSSVKLIWTTSEGEKLITYMARVSSDYQDNPDIEKLIVYCIKKGHWSIFEMANLCVEVIAPLYVINQILRHKSFSFQQFSMRYNKHDKISTELNIPEFREKNINGNRQSSNIEHNKNLEYQLKTEKIYKDIYGFFDEMINNNVSYETARAILPVSQFSKIYINGNIRSWIHYLKARTYIDTQLEHREIAVMIRDQIFKHYYPIIYKAVFVDI